MDIIRIEANEKNLSLGLTLYLCTESVTNEYVKTELLGWKINTFILVDYPYVDGFAPEINQEENCIIKFIHDNEALGFITKIDKIQSSPMPLMFLRYPKELVQFTHKIERRYKTNLKAIVKDAEGKEEVVEIMDISLKGCSISIPSDSSIDWNSKVSIALIGIEDAPINGIVSRRNIIKENAKQQIGCKILSFENEIHKNRYKTFVESLLLIT